MPQREVTLRAPAKINLFLEVLGRRPDGYHDLETLMVPIGLWDHLYIVDDPDGRVTVRCHWATGLTKSRDGQDAASQGWPPLPQGDENIAARALLLLRERAGVEHGATLTIEKSIPSAAGLGGGSSDAATALLAGNELWKLSWSRDRLSELAAELGSDVPFFLADRAAICRGRGERIELVESYCRWPIVVVCPPEGLSTAAVYRECGATAEPPADARSAAPLVEALCSGDLRRVAESLFNRLQPPAARLSAWIDRLRHDFAAQGCIAAQMSGSGTSYFGLCRTALEAQHLAAKLRGAGHARAFATTML